MKKLNVLIFSLFIFMNAFAKENIMILAFDTSSSHLDCEKALKKNYKKTLDLLSYESLKNNFIRKVILISFNNNILSQKEISLQCDNCNNNFYKSKSKLLINTLNKSLLNEYKLFKNGDIKKRNIWGTLYYISQLAKNYGKDKVYIYVISSPIQEVKSKSGSLINLYYKKVKIPNNVVTFTIYGKGPELCKYNDITILTIGYKKLREQILSLFSNRENVKVLFNY